MVGYLIENTLTENGYVSRGVCEGDSDGMLRVITERVHIEPRPGGAAYIEEGEGEVFIPAGTRVRVVRMEGVKLFVEPVGAPAAVSQP